MRSTVAIEIVIGWWGKSSMSSSSLCVMWVLAILQGVGEGLSYLFMCTIGLLSVAKPSKHVCLSMVVLVILVGILMHLLWSGVALGDKRIQEGSGFLSDL